jgi:glutathione S-transferase
MSQSIRIYSFGDVDRSGKVRWTAREIGLEVEEIRLELGEQAGADYLELNPYAQVPTAEVGGESFIESTAICLVLAERYPGCGLVPAEAAARAAFWQNVALATTTLEQPTVEYALSKWGVIDEAYAPLREKPLQRRLSTFAAAMPEDGYLHGAFTLADIFAGYILRIGIQAGLLEMEGGLAAYINRLRSRPAAVEARFFDSLKA